MGGKIAADGSSEIPNRQRRNRVFLSTIDGVHTDTGCGGKRAGPCVTEAENYGRADCSAIGGKKLINRTEQIVVA